MAAANSDKVKYEAYAGESKGQTRVTLSHQAAAAGQYIGYAKGKADFAAFVGMSLPDRTRNKARWDVAKAAVTALNERTRRPREFVEFRSSDGGTRTLRPGETRVGGNDFWK